MSDELSFNELRLAIRATVTPAEALEMLGVGSPDLDGKIHCPFHDESTPSFHCYEDSAHCFGCGWDGDVVWLTAQLTGSSPGKAVRFLSGLVDDLEARPAPRREKELLDLGPEWHGIQVDPHGVGEWNVYTGQRWGVNAYDPSWDRAVTNDGRLAVAHRDPSGIVRGIKYRTLDGRKTSEPGSCFTTALYGAHRLNHEGWALLAICEGESDCWALDTKLHDGLWATVGLPSGAQTWRTSWVTDIATNTTPIRLLFDNDDAGRKAALYVTGELTKAGYFDVKTIVPPFKDVAESIVNGWEPRL